MAAEEDARSRRVSRRESHALDISMTTFWTDVARGLDKSLNLKDMDIQNACANDILGRCFDGTGPGLRQVYKRIMAETKQGDDESLDAGELVTALFHFGLLKGTRAEEAEFKKHPERNQAFMRLVHEMNSKTWPEVKVTFDKFAWAMRRLRVAAMVLSRVREDLCVYHVTYHWDRFHGNLLHPATEDHLLKHVFAAPGEAVADGGDITEDPQTGKHGVFETQWLHAHMADFKLLLALGQRYQLSPAAQYMLCHLKNFDPQIEAHHLSVDAEEDIKEGNYAWNKMIIPVIFLSHGARRSLEEHRKIKGSVPKSARSVRSTRSISTGSRSASTSPPLRVSTARLNLAIFWTIGKHKAVVSVCSEPEYLGNWTIEVPGTPISDCLSSACCGRRRRDGYAPVETDEEAVKDTAGDDDEEEEDETEFFGEEEEMERSAKNDPCAEFPKMFAQVRNLLSEEYSRLRLGSHVQLVCRIAMSKAMELHDVLDLYKAAIARLGTVLSSRDGDKNEVIKKVSTAKFELGRILRVAQAFAEQVVPELMKTVHDRVDNEMDVGLRTARHQVKEIEHILRQFTPECKSLVDQCTSLVDEYDRRAQDRVNNILNILTFITFLVMPMQILTGLYGMNFNRMPELRWEHGYHYFWTMSVTGTIVFAIVLLCIYRVAT